MKALTTWQPYASLIAVRAKRFETRSWQTNYRGSIAIHASAKSVNSIMRDIFPLGHWSYHPDYDDKLMLEKAVDKALSPNGMKMYDLPTGCIVATAEIVDSRKIVRYGGRGMSSNDPGWLVYDDGSIYEPSENELLFGDWTPGRYAWEIAKVKMLETPIPAKGKQGLWEWEGKR